MDTITANLDEGNFVCAAFLILDFKKAIDSLDHFIYTAPMTVITWISNSTMQWFQNYLVDHLHRVKHNNQFSSWRTMKGGIPQGSSLGPLLILIYTNTLPSAITRGVIL